ncbi:hypothetical protein [Chlorogloea sp. CCALA 695]|nr:hypothetical protein [Chlorogloea sp. CCALA 695]
MLRSHYSLHLGYIVRQMRSRLQQDDIGLAMMLLMVHKLADSGC